MSVFDWYLYIYEGSMDTLQSVELSSGLLRAIDLWLKSFTAWSIRSAPIIAYIDPQEQIYIKVFNIWDNKEFLLIVKPPTL
jgi:hypothetical protein